MLTLVKIFAIVDSDCNPDYVNQIIPGNDDAVRSIRLVCAQMATAVLAGTAELEARLQAEREELELDEMPDDESAGTELADLGNQPLPPTLEGLEQEFQAAAQASEESAGTTTMVVETVVEVSAPAPTPEAETSTAPVPEAEQPAAPAAEATTYNDEDDNQN